MAVKRHHLGKLMSGKEIALVELEGVLGDNVVWTKLVTEQPRQPYADYEGAPAKPHPALSGHHQQVYVGQRAYVIDCERARDRDHSHVRQAGNPACVERSPPPQSPGAAFPCQPDPGRVTVPFSQGIIPTVIGYGVCPYRVLRYQCGDLTG